MITAFTGRSCIQVDQPTFALGDTVMYTEAYCHVMRTRVNFREVCLVGEDRGRVVEVRDDWVYVAWEWGTDAGTTSRGKSLYFVRIDHPEANTGRPLMECPICKRGEFGGHHPLWPFKEPYRSNDDDDAS